MNKKYLQSINKKKILPMSILPIHPIWKSWNNMHLKCCFKMFIGHYKNFKTFIWYGLNHLRRIGHKPIRTFFKIKLLDGWEVCSYEIFPYRPYGHVQQFPSLLPSKARSSWRSLLIFDPNDEPHPLKICKLHECSCHNNNPHDYKSVALPSFLHPPCKVVRLG